MGKNDWAKYLQINCRTCALSTPTPESTWTCARYGNAEIPFDAQLHGCAGHVLHPDLVPWKIHDSDDEFTAMHGMSLRQAFGDKLNAPIADGLLTFDGGALRLTRRGMDVQNSVLVALL